MHSGRILLVERGGSLGPSLSDCLAAAGASVETCRASDDAIDRLAKAKFDIVIVDDEIGDVGGVGFVSQARTTSPDTAIILVSGFGTIESAVLAMREGAFDYLSKPVVEDELRLAVQRALAQQAIVAENRTLKRALHRHRKLDNIVGTTGQMSKIFEVVEAVAATRATALLTGESGTGKTMLARTLHNLSPRADGPFVEVNCGALPDTLLESELFGHVKGSFTGAIRDKPGKFEDADSGTVFLDEIANASTALQVKLLRVIQDRLLERVGETKTRQVDVRIVLASNCDLLELVRQGNFREDLYYRINVVNIDLPPLRERQEDIPFLLDHFLTLYRDYHVKQVDGFVPEALDHLLAHSWPANIRELENAVERAVVLAKGEAIEVGDLPPALTQCERPVVEFHDQVLPLKRALEEPEKHIIGRALELNDWNRQKTADMLEVNRTTLFHKMKKYGLLPATAEANRDS